MYCCCPWTSGPDSLARVLIRWDALGDDGLGDIAGAPSREVGVRSVDVLCPCLFGPAPQDSPERAELVSGTATRTNKDRIQVVEYSCRRDRAAR